jgi:putative SOS response-associated peptidase YedK
MVAHVHDHHRRANELVREIHTRMPVILPEGHHEAWLNGGAGKEILTPFPADQMKARAISPRVNGPKNNDPGILEPIVAGVQPWRSAIEKGDRSG